MARTNETLYRISNETDGRTDEYVPSVENKATFPRLDVSKISMHYGTKESPWENTKEEDNKDIRRESVERPSSKRIYAYFEAEHKLLGTIKDINRDNGIFVVDFIDDENGNPVEMEFFCDEVSPNDRENIEIGRKIILVWGKRHRHGTHVNESKLIFRKDMYWTEGKIEKKKSKANYMHEILSQIPVP